MNRLSPAGFPGFDASAGTGLAATVRIAGRTFGTAQHPFGAAVPDLQADPRLAAFAMTAIDIQSWMVFDFFFTNRRIYAFYERLPFGRMEGSGYAAFSYAVPVADREPGDVHEATIAVDAASGVVRWILDGVDVYRVERSGHHLPGREHLLIDLGGEEQAVRPRQLAFGMGLFTLLDGAIADGPGLVRLSDRETYLRPRDDGRRAQSFVDEHSREESRLFGQGEEMTIASYTVHLTRSL